MEAFEAHLSVDQTEEGVIELHNAQQDQITKKKKHNMHHQHLLTLTYIT